jgi:hypothetical protein
MKKWFLLVAAPLVFLAQCALADEAGFYLGGGPAAVSMTSASCTFGGVFAPCNAVANAPSGGTTLRAVTGYEFNKHFAIELGYSQLGKFLVKNGAGTQMGDIKISATTFGFKGGGTFQSGFGVFGEIGIAAVETQYSVRQPSWVLNGTPKQRNNGQYIGVGFQYNVSEHIGFRASINEIGYSDAEFSNSIRTIQTMAVFKL